MRLPAFELTTPLAAFSSIPMSQFASWNNRFFRVEGGKLTYYHADTDAAAAKPPKFVVPLGDIEDVDFVDRQHGVLCVQLKGSNRRSLTLKAPSKAEGEHWVNVLRAHTINSTPRDIARIFRPGSASIAHEVAPGAGAGMLVARPVPVASAIASPKIPAGLAAAASGPGLGSSQSRLPVTAAATPPSSVTRGATPVHTPVPSSLPAATAAASAATPGIRDQQKQQPRGRPIAAFGRDRETHAARNDGADHGHIAAWGSSQHHAQQQTSTSEAPELFTRVQGLPRIRGERAQPDSAAAAASPAAASADGSLASIGSAGGSNSYKSGSGSGISGGPISLSNIVIPDAALRQSSSFK